MPSVKVRRSGISADQAAEVIRNGLGEGYQVRTDDNLLHVSKGMAKAKVTMRDEPDGTVFDVSGESGVSVLPVTGAISKMVNERGIAKRTADAISEAEAFRGNG